MADGLVRVRASCIPQAGLGVFAERTIHSGELLGEYAGQRLSPAEYWAKLEREPHFWLYVLMLEKPETVFIDASDPEQSNWTRYINHPPYRCRANCTFTDDGHVQATRTIVKNAELFIDYGPEYWQAASKELGIVRSKDKLGRKKKRDASPRRLEL